MKPSSGEEFKQVIKGNNIFTPRVLSYWQSGSYQCELSIGEFLGKKLFGVTVVNTEKMEHEHDLSKPFDTRKDALNYIKVLGK